MIKINANTKLNGVKLFSTNQYNPELRDNIEFYDSFDDETTEGIVNNGFTNTNRTDVKNYGDVLDMVQWWEGNPGQKYTYNFWVKFDTNQSFTVFSKIGIPDSGTINRGFRFSYQVGFLDAANWHFDIGLTGGPGPGGLTERLSGTTSVLPVGEWFMITFTLDLTNSAKICYVYLNGVANLMSRVSPSTDTNNLANKADFYIQPYYGFDEFGRWNRILSQTDITNLYNEGRALAYPFENWENT